MKYPKKDNLTPRIGKYNGRHVRYMMFKKHQEYIEKQLKEPWIAEYLKNEGDKPNES